ncbi:nicolin-1 isoform X1 [Engraulis encrasicolus]|uniref:nicolin-1 isoform X1 n=1 Tax=Engraulis encrasicolus TaxID=184585 RepID=UPI002FD188A7
MLSPCYGTLKPTDVDADHLLTPNSRRRHHHILEKRNIMSIGRLDFVAKTPVCLQIGDTASNAVRPGVCVIDIVFPNGKPIKIQEVSFKNYYTAFLSLRLLRTEAESQDGAKWVTCLRNFPLMANPHDEAGSQDYFSVSRQQMLVDPDDVTSIRLVLRQPSSSWINFNIEDIAIYEYVKEEDTKRDVPAWLSSLTPADESLHLQGLPDPQTVSSSIQQMWALTEVMQSSQTTASVGRFDVDGCYDINLLSYT